LIPETPNQTQMSQNGINLEDPEFWELDEIPGKRYPKKSKVGFEIGSSVDCKTVGDGLQ